MLSEPGMPTNSNLEMEGGAPDGDLAVEKRHTGAQGNQG